MPDCFWHCSYLDWHLVVCHVLRCSRRLAGGEVPMVDFVWLNYISTPN